MIMQRLDYFLCKTTLWTLLL